MSRRDEVGWFSRVLVPVDLDEADARAVVHAVRLAVEQAGSVHLVHVRPPIGPDTDWSALPSPRELLVQWDRIAPDGEVIDARIRTERLSVPGLDLVDAMVRAVEEVLPDLVVLDTEGRHGLARLREESVAEAIARGISMPTLFLPRRARGFVDASTGSISLRRVLVPVDDKEDAQRAVDVAMRFVECFGGTPTTFVLVHIGDRDGVPQVLAPADDPRWDWRIDVRYGPLDLEVVSAVEAHDIDLVVMTTRGRDGLLDQLLGSKTEGVVRRAACPVLSIPVG